MRQLHLARHAVRPHDTQHIHGDAGRKRVRFQPQRRSIILCACARALDGHAITKQLAFRVCPPPCHLRRAAAARQQRACRPPARQRLKNRRKQHGQDSLTRFFACFGRYQGRPQAVAEEGLRLRCSQKRHHQAVLGCQLVRRSVSCATELLRSACIVTFTHKSASCLAKSKRRRHIWRRHSCVTALQPLSTCKARREHIRQRTRLSRHLAARHGGARQQKRVELFDACLS